MKYQDWQTKPGRFLAMTGYTVDEFNELLPYFEQAHDQWLNRFQMNGKPRKGLRSHVIYSNSPLPCVEERLAFILSYDKSNSIQELHADLFGMEQKQCHEYIHGLDRILHEALKLADCVPAQTDKELQAILSKGTEDMILLHDATEREVPRPVDEDQQKDQYSGKKKKHTVKNAVITTSCCLILFVSQTLSGRIHDKTIADNYYTILKGYTLAQDTGYQGYRPEGVIIIQPVKKPKGKELTDDQKEHNRTVASFRVRVEHAIGSAKRYRIVKDECRLRKNGFVDRIFATCAALHNFRIKRRPFQYENKLT